MRLSRVLAFGAVVMAPAVASAQKKVLTQADWDKWKSIQGAAISNDGKWALYSLVPQVGDGEMIVRATQGAAEYHVPRGYLGRPNNVPGGLRPRATGNPEDDPTGAISAPGLFTADSKYAVVLTYPAQAEFERASRNRRAGAAVQNRSDLAIVSVADGKVTTVPRVRSFRLPANGGTWLAFVLEDSAATPDAAARGGRGGAGAPGDSSARAPRRQYGNALVLRNLATGADERIPDVQAFFFDDSAKVLGYTVVSRTPGRDGAYVRNLATGATTSLLTGTGDYKGLVLDRASSQAAFLSNRDEFGKPKAGYSLYYASLKGSGGATAAVTPAAVPKGMRVSDNANIAFTRNGNAISFGVAPILADSVTADSLAGKAVFDLWHYKDPQLQPTQRLNAGRDRNRSHQSLYFIGQKKLVTLAVDSLPNVSIGDDGKVVLGTSRERYNIESMWGDGATDVYVIDGTSGAARLVREHISGNATLSPADKYIAYFDKGHWYTYNTATGKTTDITTPVKGVSFAQETADTPAIPGAWGVAGWTKGDKSILLYDRYDVWEVDPNAAKPAVNVTDSVGRKNNTVLRLLQFGGGGRGGRGGGGGGFGAANDTANVFDANAPLFIRALNEETKAAGFYRDQLGVTRAPEATVIADVAWGTPLKAKNAEEYLVTKGTFVDFPNLYAGPSLTNLAKISDANPQQKDYNWGTVELVRWISTDGHEQKGMLYKPENFDPSKKYPMISYFYEQLSNGLHNYVPPNGRNVINPTHYVSNGYLIFEPDIHYELGYPGPSAMKSVMPGVQMLLQRGYVDPKRLGLQGQSWGGYQTLYMITQTQMFAAAMAGAPVVNMTSAYGGIRWGSGIARSGQYENGQSRIGGSIWENPMRYIENSPLFWLDKVTTPLFIMANDADDAVPWYQGIETFVGMRRLGKEVYFISYNNDVHNPAGRANQKDIAMRMQQFFDNKLKGATEPDWMVHGIPYRDKGRDQLATVPAQP